MPRYTIPEYKDLPAPFNILGARFRLAKIRFRVVRSHTGCAIKLILPPEGTWSGDPLLERAWAIWQGTKG